MSKLDNFVPKRKWNNYSVRIIKFLLTTDNSLKKSQKLWISSLSQAQDWPFGLLQFAERWNFETVAP